MNGHLGDNVLLVSTEGLTRRSPLSRQVAFRRAGGVRHERSAEPIDRAWSVSRLGSDMDRMVFVR
jgi:hypothetical protein